MRRRQFLLASTGALAACALPKPHTDPHSLTGRLRALAVSDDDFYRPVLYTWTTRAGIESLRARPKLLTATATTGGFVSAFVHLLVRHARDGSKVAEVLASHPALIRRRYAWPAPFATVMGLGRRTYGSSLVRIELRPDAWIARFAPEDLDPFSVVDAQGAAVSEHEVLAAPHQIGAVFHVHAEPAFREYVVCSEAMVARWSIATPEIADRLAAEAKLLRELRDGGLAPDAGEALWRQALAFDNERYHARAPQLDRIIAALAAYDPAGAPLVHAPAYSARSASHSPGSPT